ncbi:hypothetical protein [Gilliamella sp. Occ4-3]|uniref:hypothetical protein n=1 Tax=Gilliamella sp. Occ4-3 TaxID=3120254 RepID=UPI00080EBA24|nr:hypothetical protein [Gilliamella apicola]OCG72969.1 hypothetical protein A9G44_09180 [Gilliamella apicola]
MINISNERISFEYAMRKNGCPDIHLRKDRKGGYLRKNMESAFQGWVLKATQSSMMTKQATVTVSCDLLNELLCAQNEIIVNYKINKGEHIYCGRWNEEINDFIETYNQVAEILNIEKMKLVPND